MVLELKRSYLSEGTNGLLTHQGVLVCKTIELPWRDNAPRVSCVPEGRYLLRRRHSAKFGWHYELVDVPGRHLILIHKGNDALQELQGCIAPVMQHTGMGRGTMSGVAFMRLRQKIYEALSQRGLVHLVITS